MQISERPAGDVMIVDVSGKITLGDGGDVMLKDKMRQPRFSRARRRWC